MTEEPESSPQQRWIPAVVIGGGVLGFCLCALVITAATSGLLRGALLRIGLRPEPTSSPTHPGPTPTSRPTHLATTSAATPTPGHLSPQVQAAMDQIQTQVIQLRGLKPLSDVERQLISPSDLQSQVQSDFLSNYTQTDAKNDSRVYTLLGLLPSDFDLWDFYNQLYAEQVAGYYDDENKVMYVVQGSGFNGPERLTYAHEYTHALQDQHFGLRENLGYTDAACEENSERCAGVQALVEGDATQLEDQWLRNYATQKDIDQILAFYSDFQSPVYDSAPAFIKDSFAFPYTEGLNFVQALYRQGNWSAVDDAYQHPPSSTEQILHPERYPEDTPVLLADLGQLDDSLGSGWSQINQGTFGELFTRQVMEAFIPKDTAATAAEGWGGDEYQAFANDSSGDTALVLVAIWDTIRDSQDAFLGWRDYGDARFGTHKAVGSGYEWDTGQAHMILDRQSNQTLLILSPAQTAAAALQDSVSFPLGKR
jgi:hypothetical protein